MSNLISILSGGAVVAIISMVSGFLLNNRKERVAYLREQIDKFYGPLFFMSFQKEVLQKLCNAAGKSAIDEKNGDQLNMVPFNKWTKEMRAQLREFELLLEDMLKTSISLIDIEDVDTFQSGVKALKAICSYHDECVQKESDPSYELAIFKGDTLLGMIKEVGNFFVAIKEKFYTKKNKLIKLNEGFGYYCQKMYSMFKTFFIYRGA